MARRVLGDDPFEEAKPDDAPKTKPPAGAKKSAPPKSKTSAPPKPRASSHPKTSSSGAKKSRAPKRPSEAPPVEVPPPARVPSIPADEEPVALADLPPDIAREGAAPAEPPAAEPSAAPPSPDDAEDLEGSIRALEERLDRLLRAARDEQAERAHALLDRMAERLRSATAPPAAVAEEPARPEARAEPAADDGGAFDVSKELLSSGFYLRRWGRVAMRDRSEEVDELGYDPDYDARWRPAFDFLYERWWRVEVTGLENVPAEGPVALVANHSGAVPYDGIMLAAALRRELPAPRQLRWLAEDFIFHLPFAGAFLTRLGAVRACQENAERLLRRGQCVAMFPEGVKGISKLYRERYRLQRFGRGGHIKLALRTRTPVVPVAIVGAEETHPLIAPGPSLARMLGVPYFPVTPTFPLLGPLGLLPLPSKWRIVIGEALPMEGYGPAAADDDVLVGRLNEKLRGTIQEMLEGALRQRRSVFSG